MEDVHAALEGQIDLVEDLLRERRRVAVDWFREPAGSPELRAERLSVESFLQDASSLSRTGRVSAPA